MLNFKFKSTLLVAGLAAAIMATPAAQAQRVEPMRFELDPSGSGTQTTVLVTNTRSFPITIEAVPSTLTIDENGEETLAPAEDDFLIFPPQAVIAPGKSQSIRVRYIGDGVLDRSKAYRIGINQLPIDMRQESETGVSVTVNFATLVNVVPSGSRNDLSVTEIVTAEDGNWRLRISNEGTRYARLSDFDIRLTQGGQSAQIDNRETQRLFDKNLVLPGNQLYVTMPAQDGFDPRETTIMLVESS